MKDRFRTLHFAAVVFVLMIMMMAGAITGMAAFVLDRLELLPLVKRSPMVLLTDVLLVSVVLGTVIAVFATKTLLRPIRELIEATKVVAKGDLSVRVREDDRIHELADLKSSFNRMIEDLGSIEMFRNDFINTFSHELKTPIVSIRGFAKQLKQGGLTEEQQGEYIDIILSESERLAGLSSNVLLLAKFENQQLVLNRHPFALDEQLRACVLLLERQWSKKQIEFQVDMEPTAFNGNEEMLAHVWLNLLQNAIAYSPDGGQIALRLSETADAVRVLIADQGAGMDAATLKHIFEKFYQGDPARAAGGNGLGLSLVKRIVELCDGHITVESEPGHGTSFWVTLPK